MTQRTLRVIVGLLSLGAVGTSAALAAVPPKSVAPSERGGAAGQDVADRLGAIRRAVSEAIAEHAGLIPGDPNIQKAWWGNWGRGWGRGRGWRNGGWRNGGWRNGGWRNGGWPNFWRNW